MRFLPGILFLMIFSMVPVAAAKGATGASRARTIHDEQESGHGKHHERYSISEKEFHKVAKRLGVEVAAIKAVVLIEAGAAMQGFWAPGAPIVNFDGSMYARFRGKAADKSGNPAAKVPHGLSGHALRAWKRLTDARHVNEEGALLGTFWGMFQIGGFNYKKCGCHSVKEFVRKMSESNDSQLELFAEFIENTGYVHDLRAKNWSSFARKYNGAGYARRGYHTKMAAAYRRFLNGEAPQSIEEKSKGVSGHKISQKSSQRKKSVKAAPSKRKTNRTNFNKNKKKTHK